MLRSRKQIDLDEITNLCMICELRVSLKPLFSLLFWSYVVISLKINIVAFI